MPFQANRLFKPQASESPLYPMPLFDDYEIRPGEIRKFGGFPLARTDDGWRVCEHVELVGLAETED